MKPPYYHTINEALSRQDRNGLATVSDAELDCIRRVCLETSDYKAANRQKWEEFVTQNPSDKAAKYMRPFL